MALRDDLLAGLKAADASGDTVAAQHFAEKLKSLPADTPVAAPKPIGGKQLLADRLLETVQGLGFGDEFVGLIGGLDSMVRGKNSKYGKDTFSEGYNETANRARENQKSYEAERPLEAIGLQALGMIPGIVAAAPAAGAARTLGLGARLLKGAKAGATIGAISGAGNANGDLSDRVTGAGEGALTGGAFGAAIPIVPAAIRGTARLVKRTFQPAEDFAVQAVANALSKDAVAPAAGRTAITADPTKSLLDVGGKSTTALAEQGALEGQGRATAEKYFDDAAAQREGTALQTIKKTVNDKNLYDFLDDQQQQRLNDAKPLYMDAYAAPYRRTPRLMGLINGRPDIGTAVRMARARVMNDPDIDPADVKAALDPIFGAEDPNVSDAQLSQRLTQAMGQRPIEFKVLDYIKRGLDKNVESGASNESRRLRNAFRDELKTINPKYQAALNAWAGPSAVMDAVEQGRSFDTLDPEQISRVMGDMSESEQQGFQTGVARRLADMFSGAKGSVPGSQASVAAARKIYKNSVMQNRLRAALGTNGIDAPTMLGKNGWKTASDGSFTNISRPGETINVNPDGSWRLEKLSKSGKSSSLLNAGHDQSTLESVVTGNPVVSKPGPASVDDLINMSNNFVDTADKERTIIGNSATARREAGAQTFDQAGADTPGQVAQFAHALRGGVWSFLGHAAGKYWSNITQGLTSARREAVNNLLMSRDPTDNMRALQMIEETQQKTPRQLYQPGIASPAAAAVPQLSRSDQ